MSDESKGRWTVGGDGLPEFRSPDGVCCRAPGPICGWATEALVALIEAAESTEPRNQPEPLPTMRACDARRLFSEGAKIQVAAGMDGRPLEWRIPPESFWTDIGPVGFRIVARVVEPPAPATRTIRADELRPGMVLASGSLIASTLHKRESSFERIGALDGDGNAVVEAAPDAPVEVLTEGTDKP